jgi:hypothetical protein
VSLEQLMTALDPSLFGFLMLAIFAFVMLPGAQRA